MATMKITEGKGVHFTFACGFTLSIQIGRGNYGDNYEWPGGWSWPDRENPLPESSKAELALWDAEGNWLNLSEDENLRAYEPISGVLRFIGFMSAQPDTLTADQFYERYGEFSWNG